MGITERVRVCFPYQHEYRVVDLQSIWRSQDGNWLITGIDVDKGEYRSFRLDRIPKKIRVVKV
jgi:predicted DNA-binding transcriptional regulator YafY